MIIEKVLLICGVPELPENTIFELFLSFIKGPYESCEFLFCSEDHTFSFAFNKPRPSLAYDKNYRNKALKEKEVRAIELDLSEQERIRLFQECEQAKSKYRYSNKVAFESVLPIPPFLPFIESLLNSIQGYPRYERDSEKKELHCCPSMMAKMLDIATDKRFSKEEEDFSPFKVTTTDVVRLCKQNLGGKFVEKMDTHKETKFTDNQTLNGINDTFFFSFS